MAEDGEVRSQLTFSLSRLIQTLGFSQAGSEASKVGPDPPQMDVGKNAGPGLGSSQIENFKEMPDLIDHSEAWKGSSEGNL